MNTGLTRPAIVALTLGALLLVALAPAQLVLRKAVGNGLYPSLMMPSFGAQDPRPDAVSVRRLALVGVRSDGTERDLDIPAILPRSQSLPMIYAAVQFQHQSEMKDPETVAWLSRRIAVAYPDERFSAVRVIWSEKTIDIPSGDQTDVLDEKASFTIKLQTEGTDR